MVKRYIGIEAVIALIFYTILGGNIQISGLRIHLLYLIIAYLVLKYIYKLEGRLSIGVAMGLLGVTALSLVVGDEARANWAAETAYVFLVIGVVWQIAEAVTEKRESAATANDTANEDVSEAKSGLDPGRGGSRRVARSGPTHPRRRFLVAAAIGAILATIFFTPKVISTILPKRVAVKEPKKSIVKNHVKNVVSTTETAQTAATTSPPESAKTAVIKVLNGNGLPNEAGRVGEILKKVNLGEVQSGDYNSHDQIETLLRYRPGGEALANEIVRQLAAGYPVKSIGDLKPDSPEAVILTLGLDKIGLVDKAAVKIEIANGNGRAGAAAETARLLKQIGFTNLTLTNVSILNQTQIKYNPDDATSAKIITAKAVGQKYQVVLMPTPALAKGTIIVILGLN